MRVPGRWISLIACIPAVLFVPLVVAQQPAAAPVPAPQEQTSPTPAPAPDAATQKDPGAAGQTGPAVVPVKGKKKKKEKPPKTIPVTIQRGVLTVDGWAGKADLNYQIADFKYFYVWSPGLGTVVVSNMLFPGAKYQAAAFDGDTLTVMADGHKVQLATEHRLLGKKPEGAYVRLDADAPAPMPTMYPVFGYGFTPNAPYAWPGSLADTHPNPNAPPLPVPLRPSIQTTTVCQPPAPGAQPVCKTVEVPMTTGKS